MEEKIKIELKAWYFPEGKIEWHLFPSEGKIWVPLNEQEAPTLENELAILDIKIDTFTINLHERLK